LFSKRFVKCTTIFHANNLGELVAGTGLRKPPWGEQTVLIGLFHWVLRAMVARA